MIEHQRPVVWPGRRRVRREHDRREDLYPVRGELAMARLATAREPASRALGRLPVGLSLPERDERPRDLARREAVAPRCLQTLVCRHGPFALHTIGVTSNLPRQRLSERVRRAADREASKPLPLPARRAVATEELHPRPRMTAALRASTRPHQLPQSRAHATTRS
jgi:hypothetical protein